MFRRVFCFCLSLAAVVMFFSCNKGNNSPVLLKASAEQQPTGNKSEKVAEPKDTSLFGRLKAVVRKAVDCCIE